MSLIGFGFRTFYEWMAKQHTYATLMHEMEKNEAVTYNRMVNATASSFNRSRVAHVIGIERWAAHRLCVLLGEPLVMDEYDGYAPSEALSMAALAEEFKSTRTATKALMNELQSKGVDLTQTVKHNEAGDLSLRGWLFYIENHTGRETVILMQRPQNREKEAAPSN
jgi:hypothetical protein